MTDNKNKQWCTVTFSARLSDDDIRAMNKYFYNMMNENMQIEDCVTMKITKNEVSK